MHATGSWTSLDKETKQNKTTQNPKNPNPSNRPVAIEKLKQLSAGF